MINPHHPRLSIHRQCELVLISRASFYRQPAGESLENLERANEDLRTSRARIVATGDAERRKIERNLHDGAQQHLVALAVNLRLAKDMLDDDPYAAAEMLDALADAVKETIQELRDLVPAGTRVVPQRDPAQAGARGEPRLR